MAMFKAIKSLVRGLRSAYQRANNFESQWDNRRNPIDSEVLNQSRLWSDGRITQGSINVSNGTAIEAAEKKDARIEKKPVEVVKEIIVETPVFEIKDLPQQLKVITKRLRVLKEQGVHDRDLENEKNALGYLKARQKYVKTFKLFRWATSNQASVIALTKKYKLHVVGLEEWVKTLPVEAIDEIQKYAEAYAEVRKDKPEFRLVVNEQDWKEIQANRRKRDPILLALSPFGNWYYVLGAWDKEVQYVDDLIYNGK